MRLSQGLQTDQESRCKLMYIFQFQACTSMLEISLAATFGNFGSPAKMLGAIHWFSFWSNSLLYGPASL